MLRSAVGARYEIVSESMWPTLRSAEGDQVLVDKTAFRSRVPERFEVVVLKPGGATTPIVKRAFAVGPGRVALRNGDVYFQGLGTAGYELLQKDPIDPLSPVRAIWRSVEAEGSPFERLDRSSDSRVEIASDDWLRTDQDLFGDAEGQSVPGRSRAVDFGLRLQPDWDPSLEWLEIELRAGERIDRVRVEREGSLSIVLQDSRVQETAIGSRSRSITVQRLDGRLCVHDDRGNVYQAPIPSESPPDLVLPGGQSFNGLAIRGHTRDGSTVRLAALEILADVYYPPEEQAFELAEGDLFVLGDNPPASEDSRERRGAPFRCEDLLGRVVAILRNGRLLSVDS